jgi:hypothetical protein
MSPEAELPTSAPGPSPASYLEASERYAQAVEILADRFGPVDVIGLLASHSVELCLKGFLLHRGASEREIRRLGHDLNQLWEAACLRGLGLLPEAPFWICVLSSAHDHPYLYRYPQEGVGSAIPEAQELKSHLRELLQHVSVAINRFAAPSP